MGTHPIFESDFDCLTDFEIGHKGDNNLSRAFHVIGHSSRDESANDWQELARVGK